MRLDYYEREWEEGGRDEMLYTWHVQEEHTTSGRILDYIHSTLPPFSERKRISHWERHELTWKRIWFLKCGTWHELHLLFLLLLAFCLRHFHFQLSSSFTLASIVPYNSPVYYEPLSFTLAHRLLRKCQRFLHIWWDGGEEQTILSPSFRFCPSRYLPTHLIDRFIFYFLLPLRFDTGNFTFRLIKITNREGYICYSKDIDSTSTVEVSPGNTEMTLPHSVNGSSRKETKIRNFRKWVKLSNREGEEGLPLFTL